MPQVSDKEIIFSSLNSCCNSHESNSNVLNIKNVNFVFDEPAITDQKNSDILTESNNRFMLTDISDLNKHKRSVLLLDDLRFPYGSFIHSIYSFSSNKFSKNKTIPKLTTRIIVIIIIITVLAIAIVIILVVLFTTKSEIFNTIQIFKCKILLIIFLT